MQKGLALAQREGIRVTYPWLPVPYRGVYWRVEGKPPLIMLNNELLRAPPAERRSVFWALLGRHFTWIPDPPRPGHRREVIAIDSQAQAFAERSRALSWAARNIISFREWNAYCCSGIGTLEEAARWFDVTPELCRYIWLCWRYMRYPVVYPYQPLSKLVAGGNNPA